MVIVLKLGIKESKWKTVMPVSSLQFWMMLFCESIFRKNHIFETYRDFNSTIFVYSNGVYLSDDQELAPYFADIGKCDRQPLSKLKEAVIR